MNDNNHNGEETPDLTEENSRPSERTRHMLDRRTYMEAVGATAATAGLFGASGTATAASYETVTIPNNETEKRFLSDNDTLENVLFDATAYGASVKIVPEGSNWIIRNVGVKGRIHGGKENTLIIGPKVSDGSTGIIENVYLGDGCTSEEDMQGIYIQPEHAGTLKIRRTNLQHWANNGIYGSPPGLKKGDPGAVGAGGAVQIEQCYARNNNLASYRVGTDGSYVRDSVAVVDDDLPYAYKKPEKVNGRGVWVKEGADVTIENCDILLSHPDGSRCVWEGDADQEGIARVRNSQLDARGASVGIYTGHIDEGPNVGRNPDVSVPAGVPQSAAQAANGGDGGGGGKNLPNGISVQARGSLVDYSITVSGELRAGAKADNGENPSGGKVSGTVNNYSSDNYTFSGEIVSFEYSGGDMYVSVNGESKNPDTLGQPLSNGITIQGRDGGADYSFTVSGEVRPGRYADGGDGVSGNSASGNVANYGHDNFQFSGEITSFEYSNGSVAVTVNGESKNPDTLGQSLSNGITIQGRENGGSTYSVSVSGTIQPGENADGGDHVSDNHANGNVAKWGDDNFKFSGNITSFSHDGDVAVTVNGQSKDPDQLG